MQAWQAPVIPLQSHLAMAELNMPDPLLSRMDLVDTSFYHPNEFAIPDFDQFVPDVNFQESLPLSIHKLFLLSRIWL
jgi:hypothetical protein